MSSKSDSPSSRGTKKETSNDIRADGKLSIKAVSCSGTSRVNVKIIG